MILIFGFVCKVITFSPHWFVKKNNLIINCCVNSIGSWLVENGY